MMKRASADDLCREQFDRLSGLGPRQLRQQKRRQLLEDPVPLQMNFPADGVTIEPEHVHGFTRDFAYHSSSIRCSLNAKRTAVPIDLV